MKTNNLYKSGLIILVFLSSTNYQCYAQKLELKKNWWIPNGTVETIVDDTARGRILIGGNFTSIGPYKPNGALVDYTVGSCDLRYAIPNDDVNAVVSDGHKGWFIGGTFTMVGDSIRNAIAHIDSNGQVTNFFANKEGFTGYVKTLMLKDSILYVGGTIDGYGRFKSNSVLIDTAGSIDQNFPEANGHVLKTLPDGKGGWYIGGNFTKVGDSLRNGLAHIDSLGHISAWNPNPDNDVTELKLNGNILYVGGYFLNIGGKARNKIAAIDVKTGKANAWNPNGGTYVSTVLSIEVSGKLIYLGGSFTTMGGAGRKGLAAVDSATGIANSWNPAPDDNIYKIVKSGNSIYVGGIFKNISGKARTGLVAYDSASGKLKGWDPKSDNNVKAMIPYGNKLYIGGDFTSVGGQTRNRLAILDTTTATAGAWNPNAGSFVTSMTIIGNNLYVIGQFQALNGKPRYHIGAVDINTGALQKWRPSLSSVNYISSYKDKILIGAANIAIVENTRKGLASINIKTRKLTDWNPDPNGLVTSLAEKKGIIYIGGGFTQIGGQARKSLAALDAKTGNATAWDPSANTVVYGIKIKDSILYTVGTFSTIGGQSRGKIAAVNLNNAAILPLNLVADNDAYCVDIQDSILYVGGKFSKIGSNTSCKNLFGYNLISNKVTFSSLIDGPVKSVIVKDNFVYAGGLFLTAKGLDRINAAIFDRKTAQPTAWVANPDNNVYTMALGENGIYIGGAFNTIGGITRRAIAALDPGTGIPTSWDPGASATNGASVMTILARDTVIYVGGFFSSIGKKKGTILLL